MAKVLATKVVLAHVLKFGARTALLLALIGAVNAESERCVPAADGGWHCGKDVTEADAAPLPERQSRTLPPVMLIDPARFGEGDNVTDAPPEASAEAPVSEPPVSEAPTTEVAEVTSPEVASPEAASPETAQMHPASETPAARTAPALADQASATPIAEATLPTSGKYVVQLAVASSPRGFDAVLTKLGAAARTSQRRQLTNGSWVLLIGSFDSIAAARNAIPSSVPGAFARDISALNFK